MKPTFAVTERKGVREMTNYDRIKAMSVKEMAIEHIYFVPDHKEFHYTGLSGLYTKTAEETIQNNIEWLESECDTE
jgi:hypothetical protein